MVAELARTPPHETAEGRRKLKAKGQTAYGTSFPVPNVAYLKKALQAVGRAPAGKRGVLARFLRKRARELGAWNVIKGSWADNTQGATAMANAYVRAIQLSSDVSSASGPRVTKLANGNGGAETLKERIKAKLMAKGMPEARAEQFAENSVKMLMRRRKASTVSMANMVDEDGGDVAAMCNDAQKTLSHMRRVHHLNVNEVTSPIADHRGAHEAGSTAVLVRSHRASGGQLMHSNTGSEGD